MFTPMRMLDPAVITLSVTFQSPEALRKHTTQMALIYIFADKSTAQFIRASRGDDAIVAGAVF